MNGPKTDRVPLFPYFSMYLLYSPGTITTHIIALMGGKSENNNRGDVRCDDSARCELHSKLLKMVTDPEGFCGCG